MERVACAMGAEAYLYPATAFVGINLPDRVRSSLGRGASLWGGPL